jgi:Putative prokaryotic signal transducing protein
MSSKAPSLITVANCYDIHEATRMKLALEVNGIPAFIPDEVTAGNAPFLFMTPSGVRVQVADDRAEEAKQIVSDMRKG